MSANLFQGSFGPQEVVGVKTKGKLPHEVTGEQLDSETPHPPFQALKQGSVGRTTSDLQAMMEEEQKRHMDQYRYANGHNDHGMGQ